MKDVGCVPSWYRVSAADDPQLVLATWTQDRLIALARQALNGSARRQADEDDVVQNAFDSFFLGVAQGRFPQLNDRDNLWRLLDVLTARKAIDQVRKEAIRRREAAGNAGYH
jgi:hypothetical protein